MPPPTQFLDDDTMPYPYLKYWEDPNAEAHVYAFFADMGSQPVSQQLTDAEAKCSKIAEFGMTLEGPTT